VAGGYRIIYNIDKQTVIVYVLAAGIRKEGSGIGTYFIPFPIPREDFFLTTCHEKQ
jgi:hypothetical protein